MPEQSQFCRRVLLGGALIGLAGAAFGCGYLRANLARNTTLDRELEAYAIPESLEKVWEKVTTVRGPHDNLTWSGLGFTWKETDEPFHMRTSKKKEDEERSGDRYRTVTWFECKGQSVPDGAQVQYFEFTKTTTYRGKEKLGTEERSERRYDLELELIRKFDEGQAARIEAAADKAGRSAQTQ